MRRDKESRKVELKYWIKQPEFLDLRFYKIKNLCSIFLLLKKTFELRNFFIPKFKTNVRSES